MTTMTAPIDTKLPYAPMLERYQADPVTTACPVCGGEEGEQLYTVTATQAAQHFVARDEEPEIHVQLRDHIAQLWQQDEAALVRCADCEFVHAQPYIAGDTGFYGLAYRFETYPTWKWEYDRTLAALDQADLPEEFRLLEIGAGDGAFIKHLSPARIPPENVVCTEYTDIGCDALRKHGFICRQEDVRDLTAAGIGGRCDVACLFQVFEHLDGNAAVLESLTDLCEPGAQLFIAVPNPRWTHFAELHGALLDMPPNHLGRWTARHIAELATPYGWELTAADTEPAPFWRKAAKYVKYHYFRKGQQPATLASRLKALPDGASRRAGRLCTASLYALGRLPTICRLASDDLGGALWCQLTKTS